ncbi:MAG: hypothetical protein E3J86_13965 [Candidatus Thorarchaeota archaeon]|nr:MAG: hypothetical protein E3J86_13965 [Candidatus Thorarchaeota archaeon]
MQILETLLVIAVFVIMALVGILAIPWIRRQRDTVLGDSIRIETVSSPFQFKTSSGSHVNDIVLEAINRMGGFGEEAEEQYQASLEELKEVAEEAISIVSSEYKSLSEEKYLNRWSLIHLISELRNPLSLEMMDEVLTTPIPPERSKVPKTYSTRADELMIRTTAIEAITRIASDGQQDALDLLLVHSRHKHFSIKRAAIQGYLKIRGDAGRAELLKSLPKSDHRILDIKRTDVREVPQAIGGEGLKFPDKDDTPSIRRKQMKLKSEGEEE